MGYEVPPGGQEWRAVLDGVVMDSTADLLPQDYPQLRWTDSQWDGDQENPASAGGGVYFVDVTGGTIPFRSNAAEYVVPADSDLYIIAMTATPLSTAGDRGVRLLNKGAPVPGGEVRVSDVPQSFGDTLGQGSAALFVKIPAGGILTVQAGTRVGQGHERRVCVGLRGYLVPKGTPANLLT